MSVCERARVHVYVFGVHVMPSFACMREVAHLRARVHECARVLFACELIC